MQIWKFRQKYMVRLYFYKKKREQIADMMAIFACINLNTTARQILATHSSKYTKKSKSN